MTIMQKICSEVNKKFDMMIEKNRLAAIKNRLKIAIAGQQKQLDKIYMEIGKACVDRQYRSDDEKFAQWYAEVEEGQKKIERFSEKLAEIGLAAEDNGKVIHVSFGQEDETLDYEETADEVQIIERDFTADEIKDTIPEKEEPGEEENGSSKE